MIPRLNHDQIYARKPHLHVNSIEVVDYELMIVIEQTSRNFVC